MRNRSFVARLFGLLSVIASIVVFEGCDSSDPSDGSTFSAEIVAGNVQSELSGAGTIGFTTIPEASIKGFGISLSDGDNGSILMFTPQGRPEKGTYSLVAFSDDLSQIEPGEFLGYVTVPMGTPGFRSTSGSLTFTTSTPTRVAGHFSFTAKAQEDGAPAATVEGSFDITSPDPLPDFPDNL